MRILQCVPDIDPAFGGSVEAPRLLTSALGKQGHSVEVLTLGAPRPEWVRSWPAAIHCPGPSKGYYKYSKFLVSWLKAHAADYDVLVVHGVWRYTSVGVWRVLRKMGVPYVLYTHGMLAPFFNQFWWKRFKKLLMWRVVEHRVLRDARLVIFTCEEERVLAAANFSPFKCVSAILSLGIDGPEDAIGPKDALSSWPEELQGKHVLLFLARLHPQKGCDTLLSAFARVAPRYPDVHVLITGPDDIGWKAGLMELAERLGIASRITWHGPVFGNAKWEFFRKAEAYILPTNFENFGISIVEALASGLPVLISDKAMIWREIQAAGGGFISSNTVDGTAEILERWMATPPESRVQMRANALRCFQEHYSINAVAGKLATLLESVAKS